MTDTRDLRSEREGRATSTIPLMHRDVMLAQSHRDLTVAAE